MSVTPPITSPSLKRSQELPPLGETPAKLSKQEEDFTSTLTPVVTPEENPKTTESGNVSYVAMRDSARDIRHQLNRVPIPHAVWRDRYPDIMPYAFNQVGVTNGSWICFPENDFKIEQTHFPYPFIAISAPKPSQFPLFFNMIADHKCDILVTLSDPVENGNAKADVYLPKKDTLDFADNYTLYCHEEELLNKWETGQVLKSGVYEFTFSKIEPHFIKNFHVSKWEDGTAGTVEVLFAVVKEAYDHKKKIHSAAPIVVHCSAGVRRAGQFIGCFQIYQSFVEKGKLFSDDEIFDLALQMRIQRTGLGGDEIQFEMYFKFRDHLKNTANVEN